MFEWAIHALPYDRHLVRYIPKHSCSSSPLGLARPSHGFGRAWAQGVADLGPGHRGAFGEGGGSAMNGVRRLRLGLVQINSAVLFL